MPYRTLDPQKIIDTAETLRKRINERFEGRGLGMVCAELVQVAGRSADRAEKIAKPYYWVRASWIALIALLIAAQFWLVREVKLPALIGALANPANGADGEGLQNLLQSFEAFVNLLIIFGAGVLLLMQLETRLKRGAILDDLHELRALIHVIDMHQLTKDPTRAADRGQATLSSPQNQLSAYDLTRYLDYCAEMLSITGKIAALYGQNLRDEVVIEAINDLEALATNLSRKIWQKIQLVRQLETDGPAAAAGSAAT